MEGGTYKGAEEASGSHTYPAVVVQDPLIVSTARQKDNTTDAQDCLEKFWRLESIGIMDSPEMKEDDHAIENFNNTIEFRENRYHVTLPWKQPKPELPDNYGLALGRFKSLHNRLKSNHQLLEKYNAIIQDQLRQGIIEPVPEMRDPNAKLHYLPHHGVETPSRATTKLRIVFDASAKQGVKANSLNECLHRGPVILPDLAGVLLRFQLEPVGITADVEKAFLQICIKVSDRDVTRFFWYKDPTNPTTENNIKVFRFCRVVFGIVCSPFLLGATLKYHLQHQMSSVAEKTIDNVYVDNVLTGSETTQQATTIYHELKNVFRDASMNLREWQSNSEEFLESVLPEDKAKSEKYVKVLGLLWNVKDDTLQIASLTEKGTASESSSLPTKRQVLTCISNVFDPLGFLAPAVLQGKLFIQNLWKKGIEWDQPIPIELESEWNQLLRSLQQVDQFKLPRFVGLKASQSKTSLIAFVDASAKAYAVVVYLRMQDDGKTTTKLIFAKTRVAPKSITLPRLELMALVLGVRAIDFVKTQLKIAVQKIQVFSDSQCVLKWITTTKPLSTFVSNRLKEILSHQDIVFSYVPSGDNSADCASRGLSTEELKNFSLWWNGPKWLTEDDDKWPKWNLPEVTPDLLQAIKQEVKKVAFHQTQAMLASEKDENGQPALPVHRFSKLNKLVKTTCIVLRFLKMRIWDKLNSTSQQKYAPKVGDLFTSPLGKGHFTAQDYKLAKAMLLRQEQQRHCADIFANLTKDKRSKMGDQLGIYLDSDGILRCSGRLANANLPHDTKFPKLLPRQSDLTKLIIEDVHQHCGVQQTLATIRNEFWIPKGRLVARSQLRKCVTCSKVTGAPYKLPPMPQLPVERITKSRPFQYVGLDYFGPVFIKNGSEKSKVWVSLFTCLATRAVHLEVARDMSTEKFLNCLRRFVARRGQPSKLISDNAAQFKLAKTTLDQAWSQIFQSEDVVNYCAKEGMEWHFIPEFAPWQGGAYERMVGLCKSGLKKAIGHKLLEMDQFETLLCEAEAVVNSRPLTYNTSDISSPIILHPIDFLISHGQVGTPQLEDDANDPEYVPKLDSAGKLLKYFRSSQKCLDFFWNFWSSEYLQSLRERYGTQHPYPRGAHNFLPQEGTVVLMKEEHMPRATWKIGRISKLIHGHDDHIRSVEVALPNKKTLTRPINLLYPIELQEKQETTAAASNYASVSSNFKLLNSHAMLMMVILLLASFLVPTMANKCPEPDEKIKGLKSIWSSSCIASGYVVMRDGNNHLCWRKVACANGHLNNKGTCSHTCKCPEWATHCSHGVDKWPKIAHTEKTPLVLELARPNICAFQPSNNCNSEPVHIRLPQIELLNGTKVFIKALNIKWIQHVGEDFECIGSGRLSGTTEFCQKHECVQEATKFCKYAETELAFFFNAEGEIPIRAYGEIPLKVYMEKTTEKHIECPTCELKCIRGGVEAKLTVELGLLEICSPPICYKQSFPKPIESVLFPAEINLVEHQISVKIWSKGMLVKEMMTTCPPTPFCEMIDCYICWARIANPQCSSKYWLILAAVMVYFFSLTMYIGLKIVQLLGKFILLLLRALVLCGKVCFKCCRKAKTKTYETVVLPVFTLLEDENVNETEGDPLPTASQPLLKQTPAKLRLGNKPYRLKHPYLATTIVALSLIPMANCCSEVTSLTAHYTGCTVSQNGTAECVFNEVTRIALSPQGQESCLLLKDPMGEPLGTLSVEVKKIVLKCQSKTEYYTRSYEMKTRASKRCPNAGSCSSPSKCGDVKLTSKLEELKGEANDNPGFTYCAEACGSPFCGCFWWTYACLFYRTYASPLTDPVYEAFSCPFWKYCLSANVKFTTEGNTKNHRFNLLPGIVSEWKNMRFTLISITDPPIPLLSKSFLTNGKVTILTDVSASGQPVAGTVGSLQCRSWEKAQNFDCDIPHSLCNCQPMDPRVSCTCTNGNLGELFKHQEKIIPLSTEGVHLSGGGKEIEAELTHYTAMEFQISMKNFRLSTKIEKNFCTITPAEFGGCYNCITGAKLKYLCTTDFGDATAHVVCGKATFSTACKSKGLLRTTNIVFSTPVVEEECTVRCPAGTTSFKLSGQLVFVERGLLFNASNIVTGNHSIDSPFDFGIDVLKGITSWFSGVWQTVLFFGIVFLLAVLLIPIAPYLLHLAFRIMRLGIQHFARNVAKLLRHNQQSRKKAWKNSAKQW
ncbi:MAG: DDE-type integrase/transposase/recombinase [Gammaproteobacteria bacterium]|nr:DDE-type integrase/transposase/recombinase [Gammaproteobacteria bacterium]